MLALSDTSIKMIMQCLYGRNDMKTLRHMRRGCFQSNRIATLNNLNKRKPSHLTLSLDQNAHEKLELCAYIGIHIQDYMDERLTALNDEMGLDNGLRAQEQRVMMAEIRTKHKDLRTCHIVDPKVTNINLIAKKALTEVLQKARSINGLTLYGFTLNTKFLHLLMQFQAQFREATTIKMNRCYIKWTENQLSQCLALFDNLREIYIHGVNFHRAIVSDQHLSLATLEKISIICTPSLSDFTDLHFPGITSKSCESWLKNGLKRLCFLNMSTEFTYSALSKLAEELKLGERTIKEYWLSVTPLNFGGIKYSANMYLQILIDQKNLNEQWKIYKYVPFGHQYMVTSNNKTYAYQFKIYEPCEVPDFVKLLASVQQLRVDALVDGTTLEDTTRLYYTTRTIGAILKEYQNRKDLAEIAKSNIHDAAAAQAIPNNRIDQRIVEAKRFAFSHSLYHEEVIMLRMRELEEPQPEAIV